MTLTPTEREKAKKSTARTPWSVQHVCGRVTHIEVSISVTHKVLSKTQYSVLRIPPFGNMPVYPRFTPTSVSDARDLDR